MSQANQDVFVDVGVSFMVNLSADFFNILLLLSVWKHLRLCLIKLNNQS